MNHTKVNITEYGFTVLQIETISSCNMQCSFCAFPVRKEKNRVLGAQFVHGIVDSIEQDPGLEYICFSHYNEPLLDARLFDFITYAKERGFPVMVITNGLLFNNAPVISSLLHTGVDFVKISLQNLDEKQFAASRKTGYAFSDYKKGIFEFLKQAKDAKTTVFIDVGFNFVNKREKHVYRILGLEMGDPSITDIASELKTPAKAFLEELQDYEPGFRYHADRIGPFIDRMKKGYREQEGFSLSDTMQMKFKKFIYGRRQTDFQPVAGGARCASRILSVLAGGSVVPCCLVYDEDTVSLGSIKEASLPLIMRRQKELIEDLRRGKRLPETCRRCLGAPTKRGALIRQVMGMVQG